MRNLILGDQLMYASYFAPRGRKRLYILGQQVSERYLSPLDRLIGIIGEAGAGKSSLVKGMFPGLELTNDDDGVNIRPLPLLRNIDRGFFASHTYHLDVRFEMAFTQLHVLADAVGKALEHDKRVIVEHFDLLYPVLGRNADVLVGMGGEVIVVRPTLFGPRPQELYDVVCKTLKFRKMAHTAEDLTEYVLQEDYNFSRNFAHRDVYRGFVLEFSQNFEFDLDELEQKILALIAKGINVSYVDEEHILMGDKLRVCTGPRTHVKNTEMIENFRLIKPLKYDPKTNTYLLIGLVGPENDTLDGFVGLNYAADV